MAMWREVRATGPMRIPKRGNLRDKGCEERDVRIKLCVFQNFAWSQQRQRVTSSSFSSFLPGPPPGPSTLCAPSAPGQLPQDWRAGVGP